MCPVLTTWHWTDSSTLSGHWLCVAPHLGMEPHGIPLSLVACPLVLSSCWPSPGNSIVESPWVQLPCRVLMSSLMADILVFWLSSSLCTIFRHLPLGRGRSTAGICRGWASHSRLLCTLADCISWDLICCKRKLLWWEERAASVSARVVMPLEFASV